MIPQFLQCILALALHIDGLALGQSLSEVKAKFPALIKIAQTKDGLTRYQCKGGLEIWVDKAAVSSIVITSPRYAVDGVRVGDSEDAVKKEYGPPKNRLGYADEIEGNAFRVLVWDYPMRRLKLTLFRKKTSQRFQVGEIKLY
jgi:hypothetical protein